jgi:hypothetical protein
MADTKQQEKALVETPEVEYVVKAEGELSDGELEGVAGGFLDNLNATCNISGTANVLSSNVAIELG